MHYSMSKPKNKEIEQYGGTVAFFGTKRWITVNNNLNVYSI